VLEALRCVSEVRIFDGDNAIPLIKELKPDVLTCGFGYTPDKVVGRDIVEEYGGRVVITCEGDAKDQPSTTKIVKRTSRNTLMNEACRAAEPYSVNPFNKLWLMADEFMKVAELPGDVADLGAYQGATSIILHRLAPNKDLHIFDTWAGNPYDDPLCHHKKGEWKASLKDCRDVVGRDERAHYHDGVFPDRALNGAAADHNLDIANFCFVYVDMDTYQATKDAIEFFWPRLVQSGAMFFDDWGWEPCAGVKKAVLEAFPQEMVRAFPFLYSCVVEKK
jgi:hypothetical protein